MPVQISEILFFNLQKGHPCYFGRDGHPLLTNCSFFGVYILYTKFPDRPRKVVLFFKKDDLQFS